MNYKKLLATAVFTLGAWMNVGVAQADIPTWTAAVGGTNYDFTYFTGTYNGNSSRFNTTEMPWWGPTATNATAFATAVGNHLGFPNDSSTFGPYFAYSTGLDYDENLSVSSIRYRSTGSIESAQPLYDVSRTFATATVHSSGAAPEMNASLIPQVGLLLGCLFFLTGRKKEVVQPLLTV